MSGEYNPRGGIVPDLADRLMIEALIDIRDILHKSIQEPKTPLEQILERG
ncbi:hypothetical protein ES703_38605 [subsurface metagenome]